ncbi:DUF7341 domain-containing protein [Nocardioides sp. J54]|uniref:DUF7341 domain-containing protein n=1 Tax=Nocardioides sp. J54 TaxID=935866 RepID=UPI00048AC84B|nr:hypothetical protein [Nocardioides sp. J54]
MTNRPAITDMVAQLTRPHHHAEPYTYEAGGTSYTQRHLVHAPALLDQLQHATPLTGSDHTRSGYTSRPAASIEALDTWARIDIEAARWVRDLGEDDPGDTKHCVRYLGSLLPSTETCGSNPRPDCCARHAIERDIRRWWTQARIVSGWDTAAWKPNNTCPLCATRGSLRIRIDGANDVSAMCIECRETWDIENIPLLAEHIKIENHEEDAA